jgi:hypothetical protein
VNAPILRPSRELLADQYDCEGLRTTPAKIRRGETPSESVLRALRAIDAAQRDAVAAFVKRRR